MPKGKSHPELYIALHAGMKPKDLIARGVPKNAVYNYNRRYNSSVKAAFDALLKTPPVEAKEEAKE